MGAWKQLAALPNPRRDAAAVFHDGKVYVFGGQATFSGTPVPFQNNNYIYDPAGNTWSSGAPLPTSGFCYAFSTAADGVHVLFPGNGAHYSYDPETNTWAARTPAPGAGRLRAANFTDSSGRFYLAGGQALGGGTSSVVYRYDPVTDAWTSRADVPSGVAANGIGLSPGILGNDNKVYLGWRGGLTIYDPATDAWSTSTAMPDAPYALALGVSRTPAGVVLALPHQRLRSGTFELLRRVDGYDSTTGTWDMGVIPDFPGTSYQQSVATEPGGLVYLIAGLYDDAAGYSYTTSSAWAYKQNEPPTAPTPRTLVGGVTVSTEATNRASWTFNDPNAGDSQSKFNLYYRPTGTTTWTTVTKTTPNPWYDFPAGTLDPVEYEWQLEVYDAAGEISPRTTSAIFTALDPPDGPSITYPINGQTVEQTETVVWSAAAQDSYQLRRVADDAGSPTSDPTGANLYFDTGEVAEPLTRSVAVTFPVNDRFEHVQVRVKSGGLWSEWVDVQVDVSYTPPPAPTFTVYPDADTGSLLLMITNPDPDEGQPAAAYNDVYVDDGPGLERKVAELTTTTPWRYWTPISGRDYAGRIRVVAVAANGTTASSEETP